MNPAIPRLETERLVLRGHALTDFDDCFELWNAPEVYRHISGKPSSREEVWSRLLRYVGHWELLGYGYWAACDRISGRFVGELGLADFHRTIEPPIDAPETGWVLSPSAHGRGLATEALRAVLAWSDAHLGPRTMCMIAPENRASVRVAEKCGYRELRSAEYRGEPAVLFQRG